MPSVVIARQKKKTLRKLPAQHCTATTTRTNGLGMVSKHSSLTLSPLPPSPTKTLTHARAHTHARCVRVRACVCLGTCNQGNKSKGWFTINCMRSATTGIYYFSNESRTRRNAGIESRVASRPSSLKKNNDVMLRIKYIVNPSQKVPEFQL